MTTKKGRTIRRDTSKGTSPDMFRYGWERGGIPLFPGDLSWWSVNPTPMYPSKQKVVEDSKPSTNSDSTTFLPGYLA